MAIKNSASKKLNQVYVICSADDAIDWPASDVDAYKRTLDEANLVLVAGKEPTRFLCNFELDAKANSTIEDSMVASIDEAGRMRPGLGSYNLAITRAVLRDIKNPASVPADEHLVMRRNADGTVADETLNVLARHGVITDIAAAFIETTKGSVARNKADAKN